MRERVALGLALAGLVAAAIGAIGPGDDVRTRYSWPPAELPPGEPTGAWYTPLLLSRHMPESLSVSIPCSLPAALPDARQPPTVLATARHPAAIGGLAVVRVGTALDVRVGDSVLTRIALEAGERSERADCAYRLELRDTRWSLTGGPNGVEDSGELGQMPAVSGLFSALDLRTEPAPSVDVVTQVHRLTTSLAQKTAWTVAVALALAALLLVAIGERPARPRAAIGPLPRLRVQDLVVGLTLLGWWILSPAFPDDGWVFIHQTMYRDVGGFSNYYNGFGANLPNGYWLEWLQHWTVEATSLLLWLRVPALLLLLGTWALCRWMVARMLTPSGERGVVLWSLAAAFLVGALAWGMTLRPEPVTAILATAVAACMVQVIRGGSNAPVVFASVLALLAASGHHAGLVALAPILVAARELAGWARPRVVAASALVVAVGALAVVLLFVGRDAATWRSDVRTARVAGSTAERWGDEIARYAKLADFPYATPLRRGAVALIGLAVLAYLLRRRRDGERLLDFPAATLGVGLLLLIPAPSKWPWHFGALIGLAAVAVAAETARLRAESARARGWDAWPLLAVGAAMVAASWSWWERESWNTLDLRTRDWVADFESRLALPDLATALPLLVLVGAVAVDLVRRNRRRLPGAPWRAASWTAPVLAVPLVLFTLGMISADARSTSSWTLTRQNVQSLSGDAGCGLADDMLDAVRRDAYTLVMPDLVTYLPCVNPPTLAGGVAAVPDHIVTSALWSPPVGFSTSPFFLVSDLYTLTPVPLETSTVSVPGPLLFRVERSIPGAVEAPATATDLVP
jgi:hypothetical protein